MKHTIGSQKTVRGQDATLPAWTRNYPALVERAGRILAFRCNVFAAKTAAMKRVLIREAERLAK